MIVHAMRNGAELIKRLATQVPDIILLDLLMPIMDGYAVLQELQTRKEYGAGCRAVEYQRSGRAKMQNVGRLRFSREKSF